MKRCKECKKEKEKEKFWKDKRCLDGYQSYCKDCCKKQKRKSYLKNPAKYRQQVREWRKNNPKKEKLADINSRGKLRKDVLGNYSKGKIKCNCCGEKEIKFLALDHINNNGKQERKKWGSSLYARLRKLNYPKGYQVLCHNCNMAKAFYKICPHQQ